MHGRPPVLEQSDALKLEESHLNAFSKPSSLEMLKNGPGSNSLLDAWDVSLAEPHQEQTWSTSELQG